MRRGAPAALLAGLLAAQPVAAAPRHERVVRVAAAADLKFALDELASGLRRDPDAIEVRPSFGSSGNFFAQLRSQAPFDVFLSADADYPRRLEREGLALPGSFFLYAVGRIAVWIPRGAPLDLERLGLRALLDPRLRRIAIANPRHAPYGRATLAALRSAGVYEQVAPKLVLGDNVAQAAQFAESGAADAGVLALSLALAAPMQAAGRHWTVPAEAHPRLEQGGLILKWADDPAAARAFVARLLGPAGQELLRRYGFAAPGE